MQKKHPTPEMGLPQEPTLSIIIPVDILLHTGATPFCPVDPCNCHEDPELLAPVTQAVSDGLLTPGEASRLVTGRML